MTSASQEMGELLPFYVNGTLDDEERAAVEAALAQDAALDAERRALGALRDQMQDEDPGYSPGEMGLARLMREIDAEAPAAPVARALAPWKGLAAAAVLTLAAVLAAPLLFPEPVYEQASGDTGEADLVLTFRPDATEAQITALLLDRGLVIVEGPTAIGLYHVDAPDGEDLAALADALRAQSDVIEGADPVE